MKMKTAIHTLTIVLLLAFCLATAAGCVSSGSGDAVPTVEETAKATDIATEAPTEAPTEAVTEEPEPCLTVDQTWRIVISVQADDTVRKAADALATALKEKAGLELAVVTDTEAHADGEIVLGHTNRNDTAAIEKGYAVGMTDKSLHLDAADSLDLYFSVLAVTEAWLTADFGLTDSGVVTLPESRIADINGLSTKRDHSIKILTQNLSCGDDPNGNTVAARTRRFRKQFAEYKPDLVGTQEATYSWNQFLKNYCGKEYGMVGCSRDGREATSGEWSTILYRKDRFELLDSDTTWLSYTPTEVSKVEGAHYLRICTWALLKDKQTGETILIANTHLDNSNDTVRNEQMNILLAYLEERVGNYPFYLTGDFNYQVESVPYQTATENLMDSHKTAWSDLSTENRTFHDYEEEYGLEIDFIFHNDKTTPIQYEIISKDYGGRVSDHFGVIVEFINE